MKRAGLSKRTPHDESDDAFRLLFFHHPEPMWVYDLGTRAFLEVNDAAMRKYGWRRDEFLAMSIEDLRPAKDALLPAPSAAPDGAGMARHRLKDGRLIDVRIASHALTFRGRRAELVMAQDVTETLRLHAALAQREAELHATLYSIGDAVISTDAVGRIALMNPVAERLTGWTETEARGRPLEEVFRIVNEEMRATAENPVARVLREGLVVGLANHTVLIARDGSERPIADAGAPVRDAAGAVAGVVLVFRDQSAERAAQRKIDDARRFAEGILATLREPLVVLDAALRVVQANRAFYRSFRTAPEHTEGRPLYELGNRQWDIPRLRELLEAVLPHNSHFDDFEIEHDFPQLGRRTMLLNARRLYRDGEKTDFILLAITDVTERKRAERELRESLAWFERLAETAAIAIVVYQDERFVFVNRAAEQISGYTRDELLGMRFWDVVHPEDQALVRERGLAHQRGAA
ncbi:MAG: PAS domain S-box protein, partial [Burkholderiales bacterium]